MPTMDHVHDHFSWREASWSDRVAYVFNRTALGLGVLIGIWHLTQGNWFKVFLACVFIVVYFALHKLVDAPGDP